MKIPQFDIPENTIVIFVGTCDLGESLLGYAGMSGYIIMRMASRLSQ